MSMLENIAETLIALNEALDDHEWVRWALWPILVGFGAYCSV